MSELEKLFLNLGYTKQQYEEIVNTHLLVFYEDDTLYHKVEDIYNFLLS